MRGRYFAGLAVILALVFLALVRPLPESAPPDPPADRTLPPGDERPRSPRTPPARRSAERASPVLQVVTFESGRPIAGASVLVDGRRFASDARGIVVLPGSPARKRTIEVSAPGRVPVSGVFPGDTDPPPARLRRAVAVDGTTVDARGQPVRYLGLSVSASPRPQDAWREPDPVGRTVSGSDATFQLPAPLPAGPALVEVGPLARLEGPPQADLFAPRTSLIVRVAPVAPEDTIEGILLDRAGEPIAGGFVRAVAATGLYGPTFPTGRDGGFRLVRNVLHPRGSPVRLRAGTGLGNFVLSEPVPWGSRGVVLRLGRPRGGPVTLIVLRAEDGRPVTRFRVVPYDLAEPGPYPAGRCRIDPPEAYPVLIAVLPEDPHLAPSLPTEIRRDSGPRTIRLEPRERLRVEVELPPGSGADQVELWTPWPFGRAECSGLPQYLETLSRWARSDLQQRIRLGRAPISGNRAVLVWPRELREAWLRLGRPGAVPVRVRRAQRVHLPVPVAARLAGEIADAALWPGSAVRAEQNQDHRSVTIDDQGRFEFSALEPGTWRIWWAPGRNHRGWTALATVTLEPGEHRVLRIPEGALPRPASLTGVLTRNGIPAAGARLYLVGEGRPDSPVAKILVCDAQGRFGCERLVPHTYRIALLPPGGIHATPRPLRRFRLVSGQRLDLRLDAPSFRIVLRFLDAEGRPAGPGLVRLHSDTGTRRYAQSDSSGGARFDACPPGPATVHFLPPDWLERRPRDPLDAFPSLRITVPAHDATLTVRLP